MNRYCLEFKNGDTCFIKTKQKRKTIYKKLPDLQHIYLTKDIVLI